ncbi:MAG TPA: flavodoxin domain-containing protein [Gaiellaceae bacterium]|jgi:hypothetical protein|nr:flavodoxin domain-containing protein [Gaiellaceae bacterium]
MRTAVIYETSFGSTRAVAERIADTLGATLLSVDDPPPDLNDLDLVVVGGPTHVHGMSGKRSRQAAVDQGATGGTATGVREWLEQMPHTHRLKAAAFDTRIDKPQVLTGSAAHKIAKALRRHGCDLVASPESFFVAGTEPALDEGQLEHAERWAGSLGEAAPG